MLVRTFNDIALIAQYF